MVIDFSFERAAQFTEGLALVAIGGLSGFIDKVGKIVIEPQFGNLSQPFFEGLAMVQAATGKCGYIVKLGGYAIEPIYDWAQPFSGGIASVRVGGKYGYINKDGSYLVEPHYELGGSFSEGHARVYKKVGCWYIDERGEIVLGPFGSGGGFKEGVASVWSKKVSSLLWGDGTLIPILGVDWLSQYFSGGRIEFSRSEECGYVDRNGVEVIPPVYEEASTFAEGLAAVKSYGHWGYIDASGAMVIEPRFGKADSFRGGLAHVEIRGQTCYIDVCGGVVLETGFKGGFPFREGLTPVYVEAAAKS